MVLAASAEKNAAAIMNNVAQRICRQWGFHTTTTWKAAASNMSTIGKCTTRGWSDGKSLNIED
jgi:hypothetical protein